MMIATAPGRTEQVAEQLDAVKGGFVGLSHDKLGYVRATVPTTQADAPIAAAAKLSSVHGIDLRDEIEAEIEAATEAEEAEKAEQYARLAAAAEAEKHALIDRLNRPSGKSEEEKIQLASTIIQRAVRNGLTEVQVYRFPNSLCTDKGRAIIQQEPGWEDTLTGLPKELFEFWKQYLRPKGYKIKFQIADWSGGKPGDIGISLNWSAK